MPVAGVGRGVPDGQCGISVNELAVGIRVRLHEGADLPGPQS